VTLTLDHIAQGGIYDHVGGGFARYSVDERWLVPHFEKMLYDNAALVGLMTLVWQDTNSGLYAMRVAETIDWAAREMLTAEGAFSSSLDADSEHEEGKFYVWSDGEIDRLLGERASRFKEFYDVTPGGNWEGHTIPNRLGHLSLADPATEAELAACRAVLFHARAERVRPGLDDKVLADWNGLMIAALAEAALVFERPDWLDLAEDAFSFITHEMTAPDGRLFHSWRAGQKRHAAVLDDYANMARAAFALFEATGHNRYPGWIRAWLEILDEHYWDASGGGYFFTADDAPALITRTKTAQDNPNPSGNGAMVGVLARLYYLTGDEAYRTRAEQTVATFAGESARQIYGYATLVNSNELLQRAVQIVIRGTRGEAETDALIRAVIGVGLPNRILHVVPPEQELDQRHPVAGKSALDGHATAYVCEGPVCSLPITDPAALAADLAGRG
jgi:uncharacterized protein